MKYQPVRNDSPAMIADLFVRTFSASEGDTEGQVIGQLVNELLGNALPSNALPSNAPTADLTGFVVNDQNTLVGAVLFTRMRFNDHSTVFLLSPMAIHPDYQRQGLGQALIRHGVNYLQQDGVDMVVTYGAPAFYSKVGFEHITTEQVKPPYPLSQPEGWQALALCARDILPLQGVALCASAFDRPELW